MVNRVMLTECNNPNPRKDKLFPFDKFFYEPINNRFFYGKSLAFKLQHDADIVNTLYQMVIDGTYLSIFKPMVNVGGEIIASDVIVPGAVTTLSDPNADLRAINVGSDLKSGLETLAVVEKSIDESSADNQQSGQPDAGGDQTAYEISVLEQNANTVLGLFLQMISKHVRDFGKLRLDDILQYMTVPEIMQIEGEEEVEMIYKTFLVTGKGTGASKKIEFDNDLPDEMGDDKHMQKSYDLLIQEKDKDMALFKVNPALFRELQYKIVVSPDILTPRSTELERAFNLESYDRMVAAPPGMFDPEETAKLLIGSNPMTMKDPDKYIPKKPAPGSMPPQMPGQPQQQGQLPQAGNSPLQAMGKKPGLSTAQPALAGLGQQ